MSLLKPYNFKKSQIAHAWLVWGLAALFYFLDYLARVAPTVMHRFLQTDFVMNESGFGLLTSSFYVPYLLMQIPVGLFVDRMSIRKLLTLMALLTALGCLVFGMAQGLLMAACGRMLIGFSAAFAFISALRLATSWFPPAMLGLLAGLTQALGMLGGASGQVPVSFLVKNLGWRHSMEVIALAFIGLAFLLYAYVRDTPNDQRDHHKMSRSVSILSGLRQVFWSSKTWCNALYAGFLYAPTAVIAEAIGPAYLQYGRGLSDHAAAFAAGLIFIGWALGGPIFGWMSDRIKRRKPVMAASAFCGFVLIMLVVYCPYLNTTMVCWLLFLFGFTNAGVAIAYAVSTELHERSVVGVAIAFTNMVSILVGAMLQPVVGYLIDASSGARSYHVDQLVLTDFQHGLYVLPFCSFVAFVLACCVRETHCQLFKMNRA